jgi:O-antigen ligase
VALFTWPYWLARTDLSRAANPIERASTLERSLLIGYGLDAWRAQPLTGVGAGNFVQWAARRVPERYPFEPVHNVALQALAETGVAGALALIALVTAMAWRMWRRRALMTAAEAAWAAALVGMGAAGLFDHLWWTQPPARALCVMALAAWVSAGRQRSSAASAPTPMGAMPNSRPASINTSQT